jgi:LuxR family quorum-sensing system transcriptional regulator SolR
MNTWQNDHANPLENAQAEQLLFTDIAAIGAEMGFEFCSYLIQMPVPISRPAVAQLDNFPEQWKERYRSHAYLAIDPTVQHCLKSTQPIVWSDQVFASTPKLWQEAQACGLRHGWAQSTRDISGAVGMLTLARGEGALDPEEVRANQTKMAWLTHLAHTGFARLLVPKHIPEIKAVITPREREILCWTAEGKTSHEIGQILVISVCTVNFHLKNVLSKLGSMNKIQATVKAATLGLLY